MIKRLGLRTKKQSWMSAHAFAAGVVFFGLALCGCANISVQPLQPDGKKIDKEADPGLRYYLPKPYLLVMWLPPDTAEGGQTAEVKNPPGDHTVTPPPDSPAPGAGPNGKNTTPSTDNAGALGSKDSSAPPAAVASTQFSAANGRYVAKLVYLPDLSKPMAITTSTGFGSVTLGATLQEGWMLTSLQANSDSKTAEILTAIAAGIAGARGTSGAGAKAAQPGAAPPTFLPAGLYMFDYGIDASKATGVQGVCYVTLFEEPSRTQAPDSHPPRACSMP